jgi:hypothetical protein
MWASVGCDAGVVMWKLSLQLAMCVLTTLLAAKIRRKEDEKKKKKLKKRKRTDDPEVVSKVDFERLGKPLVVGPVGSGGAEGHPHKVRHGFGSGGGARKQREKRKAKQKTHGTTKYKLIRK